MVRRQNYARKHRVPIDTVEYRHTMQQPYDLVAVEKMRRPADGAYVYGLFLEGAIWDGNAGTLAEPRPRELYCEAPIIFMKPVADASSMEDMGTYECPVYRTTERRGTLTTTGHSSNFIMSMGIPSALPGSHWTLRGACMTLERDE